MITVTMPDRYRCSITELKPGDTFIKNGKIFVTTNHRTITNGGYDAVDLSTGEEHCINPEDYLEKVSLDIKVQYEAIEEQEMKE